MDRFIYLFFVPLFIAFSCSTTKDIKDGRTAFESKQFSVAAQLLETEFEGEEDQIKQAEIAYLIGESYRRNNETRPSLKWYDKAVELGYGPEALYEMGYSLKKIEKYSLSARYFEEMLKGSARANEIKKEISKSREAEKLKSLIVNESIEIASLDLNTPASEYSPYLLSQTELVFTSDQSKGEDENYKWTGRGFSDLIVYNLTSHTKSSLSDAINTPQNEGAATFSKDRTKMFFSRCFDEERDHYCKILVSERDGNHWSDGKPVFPMDPKLNYRDPVLIENDSVLIFSCDDPRGYGGNDLYYSAVEDEGLWSSPDLMPPSINTIGHERFPTADSDTLYFSSDHFLGLGGLDIFKTYLRDDNSWSTPENIGVPFNSSDDDFGFIVSRYPRDFVEIEGYFTSDRAGKGKDDIYHFMRRSDKKIEEVVEDLPEIVEEEEKEIITLLAIKVVEKNYAIADDPNSLILGKKLVPSAIIIYHENGDDFRIETDENGTGLLQVTQEKNYEFLTGKKDYLNSKDKFSFTEADVTIDDGVKTFNLEVEIDRIFHDVEITLDNIYYDFNESFIREDAKPALNDLQEILVNNPQLKIQLSSHTDCQGTDDYNIDLSQRRAEAAIDYIISLGTAPSRISAVGYGETRLAIECLCEQCTEEEHQLNRRTTFKVIEEISER